MRSHRSTLVPVALAALLALGACGTDPDEPAPSPDLDEDLAPADETGVEGLAIPATPPPGQCVDVPRAETDVYAVGAAGTVSLAVEEGRLLVGSVQPAGGWQDDVVLESGAQVQVDFVGEGTETDVGSYTFAAELDGEDVTIEVCAEE